MPNAIVVVLVFILLMPLCSEAFERSELSISDPSHMLYIFDTPTAYFLKEGETTFILASSMPMLSSLFSRWAWHVNESVMGLGNLGLELKREPDSVLILLMAVFFLLVYWSIKYYDHLHTWVTHLRSQPSIAKCKRKTRVVHVPFLPKYLLLCIPPHDAMPGNCWKMEF